MRILSSFLLGCALAMVVFAAVGSTPDSKLDMGHRYRYIWNSSEVPGDSLGISSAKTVLFPVTGNGVGTATNRRPVTWVHITNWGAPTVGRADHILYSPTFPDGADTISTHQNLRTITFGGCQIDSVVINSSGPFPWQGSVLATD